MEHHEIYTLLNHSTVFEFLTRKWIDLSVGQYSVNTDIRFKTHMLGSNRETLVMYIWLQKGE